MQSSDSSTLTPTKSAKKHQQLISDMFSPSSATSIKPKDLPSTKGASDATAKFLRDPKSLNVAELKTLLRADGKPVSGKRSDLLARLTSVDDDDDDCFSMDEDCNRLPSRDMTPSISHPLCIIPFDGKGSDLAILVGHRIQRFQFDAITGGAEFILHTDQGRFTITYSEFSISRYAEIMADEALLKQGFR